MEYLSELYGLMVALCLTLIAYSHLMPRLLLLILNGIIQMEYLSELYELRVALCLPLIAYCLMPIKIVATKCGDITNKP